jgi:hypothetical protein
MATESNKSVLYKECIIVRGAILKDNRDLCWVVTCGASIEYNTYFGWKVGPLTPANLRSIENRNGESIIMTLEEMRQYLKVN